MSTVLPFFAMFSISFRKSHDILATSISYYSKFHFTCKMFQDLDKCSIRLVDCMFTYNTYLVKTGSDPAVTLPISTLPIDITTVITFKIVGKRSIESLTDSALSLGYFSSSSIKAVTASFLKKFPPLS